MKQIQRKYLITSQLFLMLFLSASSKSHAQDPSLELIGGMGSSLLVSSNLNIGLAVELHKANPKNAAVVVQVADQTDKALSVNIEQFRRWRQSTQLTAEDAEYLELFLQGLNAVKDQTSLVKSFVSENNKLRLEEYNKRRKETFAIIKKLTQ
jgi:hypothetical protein